MYVACPSCKILYQIQREHLHAAGGQVRCGSCRNTFNALEAVFDDPAQALAYAEQQLVERDIEALVSRALEQVPGGAAQAQQQPATGAEQQESPAGAPAEPEPPEHERAEEVPEVEQGHAVEIETEHQAPQAAIVPADTQEESLATEAICGEAEDEERIESQVAEQAAAGEFENEDRAASQAAEQAVNIDEDAAVAGGAAAASLVPQDNAMAAAPVAALLWADLDFQAQPLAAEFVSSRPDRLESAPRVPEVFLLEDEYRDGMSHSAWGAIAACLLLVALLVGQYGYVERYRLSTIPQLRPLLESGCQFLGCDLPLRSDIAQVEILEREVRDHPHAAGALLISATFVNQARFVQPYPVFSVSFSDMSGTPVAARRFRPEEYLPDRRDLAMGMRPGERAQLMLEVVDPGDSAVSFQFEFL